MCEVMDQQARLAAIEKQMIEVIENNLEFKEIFNRLMCIHGIDKVAAWIIHLHFTEVIKEACLKDKKPVMKANSFPFSFMSLVTVTSFIPVSAQIFCIPRRRSLPICCAIVLLIGYDMLDIDFSRVFLINSPYPNPRETTALWWV